MPKCEFCPPIPESGVCCKQGTLVARVVREIGLSVTDVKQIVCHEGVATSRAKDCPGYNNLRSYGSESTYAAPDPKRFPG